MNFIDYTPLARRSMKEMPYQEHLRHMSMGIVGEYGELIDAFKKTAIYGKPLDKVNLGEEVADLAWYVVGTLPELGVTPESFQRAYATASEFVEATPSYVEEAFGSNKMDEGHVILSLFPTLGEVVLYLEALVVLSRSQAQDLGQPAGDKRLHLVRTVVGGMAYLLAFLVFATGVDLSASLTSNIEKLKIRFSDKFSETDALNRNLPAERAALDAGMDGGQ